MKIHLIKCVGCGHDWPFPITGDAPLSYVSYTCAVCCEAEVAAIKRLLRDILEAARPAFPRTPFRKALDAARTFLNREAK